MFNLTSLAAQLKTISYVFALLGLLALITKPSYAQIVFAPNTDITSALNQAIAAGQNGVHPNQAVITLPAGNFVVSSSVNLHASILRGAGATQTSLTFASDLGAGVPGLTGDVAGPPFEIDDISVAAPRPTNGLVCGVAPNQMDGIHLYDSCILRRVDVNFCNRGVVIDGNHHTLDTVAAKQDYDGVVYIVSSDGTYFDDYFVDCSLTADERSGVDVADNGKAGGITMIRTHTGFEPYSFLLGHDATLGGSAFIQTQFEGVGNGDICDTDGTSTVSANYFTNCSGWGGRYSGNSISSQPTSPSLRVGSFLSNVIVSCSMMGPTPGDMFCQSGCYGNTWTCDSLTLDSITDGQLTPATSPALSSVYGNVINAGGLVISLNPATTALATNQPVQRDNGRYTGVVPATGKGVLFGVSLANVPAGEIGWIAQRGQVNVLSSAGANYIAGQLLKVGSGDLAVPAASVTDGQFLGTATSGSFNGITPVQLFSLSP